MADNPAAGMLGIAVCSMLCVETGENNSSQFFSTEAVSCDLSTAPGALKTESQSSFGCPVCKTR